MTRPYQVSRPAPLTPAERMERKRKVQAQRLADKEARQEVKQTLKLATLSFDYSELDEARRDQLQLAAFEIRARLKRTIEDMIFIGQQLNLIKGMLPDKFEEWVKAEFGMSIATASEYRNVADRFAAKIQLLYLLSPTIVRRLAGPSVPDEAVTAVIEAAASSQKPLRIQDAMAIVKPYLPVKPTKPKQLPPGSPLGPEPETIEVEYTVTEPTPTPSKIDIINRDLDAYEAEAAREVTAWLAPEPEIKTLTFAEWLALMPADLGLREQLAILTLAKATARATLGDHPNLYNAVYGALPAWSSLMRTIEQELNHER